MFNKWKKEKTKTEIIPTYISDDNVDSVTNSTNKSPETTNTTTENTTTTTTTALNITNAMTSATKKKTKKHLTLDNTRWERRLQKELMSLVKEPPPGVTVDTESIGQNLSKWHVNMEGVNGTLYEGEHFQLLFKFNHKYPFDSPQVTFMGPNIPVHPHVYSNGHICLSILTEDWSPALSVQSVCLSIASMLSSCKEKKRPPDNTLYVTTCNKNPKKTKWWYHDDSV